MKRSTKIRRELFAVARRGGVPFTLMHRLMQLAISLYLATAEEHIASRRQK